ncbi:MAG: hypothetical protein RIS70_1407 [Planctomycetota bacterium]|jgi:hypothetical protein
MGAVNSRELRLAREVLGGTSHDRAEAGSPFAAHLIAINNFAREGKQCQSAVFLG